MTAIGPRLPWMLAICAAAMVAAEPVASGAFDCSSMNPEDWPPAAKPYFVLMVSTSSSMSMAVGGGILASCTGESGASYGSDRRAHARCALKNTVEAYGTAVNFGLATFPRTITGCTDDDDGLCDYGSCMHANVTGSADASCPANIGCGAEPNPAAVNSASRAGALFRVVVPSQANNAASNVPALVEWLDGSCADSKELFASGCTPQNGMLRDAFRYYSNQWVPPAPVPGGMTLVSPLTSLANGERPCRSVHAILVTDGDESCDAAADAVDAAADLFTGFVKDGIQWRVKTHVVRFAGGDAANADAIAAAGGTGSAFHVENEAQLADALAAIVAPALGAETCDNADNDCNGCIDEGFVHYCHQAQPCCAWESPAQRTNCLVQYQASLPDGDPQLLPCTTASQQMEAATWLCQDPGDQCDGLDNNCASGPDEGCAGAPCADASECMSGFCVDGVCCDAACGGGAANDCVACSVAAGVDSDGTCTELAAGAACEDGDACTLVDACQAGVCTGTDRIVCTPPNDCQEAATCIPDTRECVYTAKADGSPCEDADPCTQGEACDAGACAAGTPVECSALDDCHDAGVCDPQTGACSDPPKPDGTPCSGGGTCSDGTCTATTTSAPTSDTGSSGGSDPTTPTTGVDASASTGGSSETGGDPSAANDGGCGCRGASSTPHGMLTMLALAASRRRSRRTRGAR